MAKVSMQDDAQRGHWLLFRRPGHFFYDYAVRYDQRNYTDGECVVVCPWLGRTFHSWLWTLEAVRDCHAAIGAAITARSGRVYAVEDGATTQAFAGDPAIFLEGCEAAQRRPLVWLSPAQRDAEGVFAAHLRATGRFAPRWANPMEMLEGAMPECARRRPGAPHGLTLEFGPVVMDAQGALSVAASVQGVAVALPQPAALLEVA